MNGNIIVKAYYKALRDIYDRQTRSYKGLPDLSGKKKIHAQDLQILMVELCKCLNNISPPFTWDYFKQKIPYNVRNAQLELSKCKPKTYGLNTTVFKGAVLWNRLSNNIRKQNPSNISNIKFRS